MTTMMVSFTTSTRITANGVVKLSQWEMFGYFLFLPQLPYFDATTGVDAGTESMVETATCACMWLAQLEKLFITLILKFFSSVHRFMNCFFLLYQPLLLPSLVGRG